MEVVVPINFLPCLGTGRREPHLGRRCRCPTWTFLSQFSGRFTPEVGSHSAEERRGEEEAQQRQPARRRWEDGALHHCGRKRKMERTTSFGRARVRRADFHY